VDEWDREHVQKEGDCGDSQGQRRESDRAMDKPQRQTQESEGDVTERVCQELAPSPAIALADYSDNLIV
jgi:hypothetical protein